MKVIRVALRVLIRIAGVAGIALAAALYYYSFHLPALVESQVLAALHKMGLPDATLTVSGVGLGHAILTDLDLDGSGEVRIESVEVGYRLADLKAGRIRKVTVTGLTLTLGYADGKLDLGPLGSIETSGESGSAELPFDLIVLKAGRLIIDYEGRIQHFAVDGTINQTGNGRLDFALTSRFEEQPVQLKGTFNTTDQSAEVIADSNGVRLEATYQPELDRLVFGVSGRRERLSLYLGGRHLLGEGLEFDFRGRVASGELAEAKVTLLAHRLAFDGRSIPILRVMRPSSAGPCSAWARRRMRGSISDLGRSSRRRERSESHCRPGRCEPR